MYNLLGGFSITGECPLFRHLETPSHVTFQEQLKESVQARLSEVGCVPPELMQLPDAKVANFETNRCKLEAVYRRDGFTWQLEVLGQWVGDFLIGLEIKGGSVKIFRLVGGGK